MAAILVYQISPLRIELYFYVKVAFCFSRQYCRGPRSVSENALFEVLSHQTISSFVCYCNGKTNLQQVQDFGNLIIAYSKMFAGKRQARGSGYK